MNIFSKMEQLVDLTNSESTLVSYIKENPEIFTKMNIDQLCKTCYVSKATVYRLCKKLDIPGLADLKIAVTSHYVEYKNEQELDYDFPIKANVTQHEIVHNIKSVYDQTITSTVNLMDLEELRLASLALKKAQQIDIYTAAGNLFFAQNFKFQMQEIGVTINVPYEEFDQHTCASWSNPKHLAIVISFGGRGRNMESIVGLLHSTKTPILLISSTAENPLSPYATRHLYMSSYENHFHKISSFSTRLSLLYILDCLYASYFKLDYDKNLENKVNAYTATKAFPKGFCLK